MTDRHESDDTTRFRGRRAYLSSLLALAGAAGLAGCSSDDVNAPEEVTDDDGDTGGDDPTDGDDTPAETDDTPTETTQSGPRQVKAALGEVVEGDRLALVAYDVERTTSVSQFVSADAGNEFVVVDMAAKNKADSEFVRFTSFLQMTLRDGEDYEYDQAITGIDNALDSGELAPGEVTRGYVVFEVPQDASALTLEADLDESIYTYSRATIDLEASGSGRTLTQDLRVEVYDVGDTLEYEATRFTANSFRTSQGGQFFSPDAGNEFVIVDITVENTGDTELSVSTLLQTELKDGQGWTYGTSLTATSSLDRGFSQGSPIPPGERRRGEIGFEVEQGVSPLYLLMDFDIVAEGDKSFFRVR